MSTVEIRIEQPNKDLSRYGYDHKNNKFFQTPFQFLATSRGYTGAYGWLVNTYEGPQKHLDAYYLTQRRCFLGESKKGILCGALYRENQDHKMIVLDYTVLDRMKKYDIFSLPKSWWVQLNSIFGELSEGEQWIGAYRAKELYESFKVESKTNSLTLLNTSMKDQQQGQHKLKNQHLLHQLL